VLFWNLERTHAPGAEATWLEGSNDYEEEG